MKATIEVELAPVRLVRSFFPVVEFEASPDFGPRDPGQPMLMNIGCDDLQFAKDPKDSDAFRVTLGLRMEWPAESVPPYQKARILCVGDFRFAPETPEIVREHHIYLSAPSMLYSGAREFVKMITANGPYMQIILPGVTFKVVPAQEETPSEQENREHEDK